MRKSTKQLLALLLAICSLASFAMPTVFATQDGGNPAPVPESVTYDFYNADWKEKYVCDYVDEINALYAAGTYQWRYEAISAAGQMRPNMGMNSFASGSKSMEFIITKDNWVALRILSPGAGKFDLTYTHGAKNLGATKGGMYIVKASVIDNALGENAQAYANAIVADPYQEGGTSEIFKAFKNAVSSAIEGMESVIDSNYYSTSTTKDLTDTGSFVFEADTEYVVVFKAEEQADGAGTARLLLTSLTATYAADQGNDGEATDPTEATAPTDDLTVNFKDDATAAGVTASTYFQNAALVTDINTAYEAKSIQWAPYTGDGTTMVHSNGYAGGARIRWNGGKTTAVLEIENNSDGNVYSALKFRAPGTGKYKLSLDYTMLSVGDNDAQEAGAYILEIPEEAYTATTLAASEENGAAKVTFTPGTQGTYDSGDETAALVYGKEYIIVFYAKCGTVADTRTNFTGFSLSFVEAYVPEGPVDPTDDLAVSFKDDATAAGVTTSTYFQTGSLITSFNTAYDAKSIHWAPYTNADGKMIHSNGYAGGARLRWNGSKTNAVFEIENDKVGDVYTALKFRAPGTGKYKLSLAYTMLSVGDNDAAEAGAYILEMPETAYTAATLATSEVNGAAKVSFVPGTQGTCDSGEDTVALKYGKEYIIVFYAKCGDVEDTRTNISDFSLTFVEAYVPEEPTEPSEPTGATEPSDATEPSVPTEPIVPVDSTTYQFYNADWKGDPVRDHTAELKTAFDSGDSKWRYEAISNPYQMRPATHEKGVGQNSFASGTKSIEIVCSTGVWFAVRIKSPGTGMYDLTFTHGAKNQGALEGKVYILDGAAVDEKLGTNAADYAEDVSNDPYQENGETDAFKAYLSAINELIDGKNSVFNPNYYVKSGTQSNRTTTGRFGFEAEKEYVVVFKSATMADDATTARLLLGSLTATYSEDQITGDSNGDTENVPTEPVVPSDPMGTTVYQFYKGAWSGSISDQTAQIKSQYDANTLTWRYEAISNPYQFGRGGHTFASGTKSMEIMCSEGVWFAVRIKSPGTGMYDLTYTHGAKANGAKLGAMYIIKAADVDAALGANAAAYAESMSNNPYQENGEGEAYKAYLAAINQLIEGKSSLINTNYHASVATPGLTDTGRFGFEADTEYVVVFKSLKKVAGESTARLLISSLTATYSEDQVSGDSVAEEDNTVELPENTYTDGLYDFYTGIKAGDTLADGIKTIEDLYAAGKLNWKYETHSGMKLEKTSYSSGLKSMRFVSSPTWWIAFRIKAPAQDGSYNIQMTHGAGGQGATAGNIFVLPGDTAIKDLNKVMVKKGPAMSTDWFYGENIGDVISGRQSGVGTVNMEAGKEYIVVFMPTEKSALSNNGYIWLGQLQATRVGDMVEEVEDEQNAAGFYEFYHYDYPGDYLHHYKTEEELGKKIVKDVIAKEYEEGLINWKHESSSGFANFAIGTPYLNATIGESYPFVLRIKSPGTGTYKIEYTHYVTSAAKAADYGYVYIVAATDKEYDYTTVRDECAYKDPIITTSYKADKNGFVTVTGEYTAFEEGKEYFLCFDVADTDNTKKPSLYAYPQSMQMTRTGDYKPEPGQEPDDGIVYNLMLGDEYKNKYLWHSSDPTLYNEVTKMYENGSLNWRLESIGGQAVYSAKYLKVGTGKEGGIVAFRVKAPGTGKYKVTLKYLLGTDIRDANSGEIYMIEAPEEYLDGTAIANMTARAPIATGNFSHTGNQMEKASLNGEFNMEAGKEYLFLIYLSDIEDKGNTTKSTWAYLDRIVMKWIGEFEPEPEYFNKGGLVAKDANRLFRTAGSIAITEVNGHDYLAMGVYGGTMMIYDLDEWRLVDEVLTGVNTPRGVALDKNGRFWTTGDTKKVYCYDPYTMTGQEYNLGLPGGSAYNITCGEDGYLYWSTMASTGAHLFRMNPDTLEWTFHTYSGWSNYIADMDQKGDYIYAGVSGEERHEMWKINKYTFAVEDSVDITAEMLTTRYIDGVEFLDENYLWFAASAGFTVIDVRTMEKLPAEEHGIDGAVQRAISGELDGKRYFISSKEGLCYYDIATQTFGNVSGEVQNARSMLRGKDDNFATIDDERLPGKSIITFGGMSADGVNLYAYNPENGAYVTLVGLVETSFAYGQDLREMGAGLPGSGEIYYGANYEAPVQVYNCLTNEEGRTFATNGQADAFHWYKDQLYIGNYNQAALTRMEDGVPVALFRLNNDVFYQARIHSISGGDDKVFVGTVPHVYQNGGVIAWYDLNTELTYVVTGPNPEDVYYAESSKTMATNVWYSVLTGEQIVMEEEWDKDEDGDGICKYFKGPIPLQSITKVVYRNGLLFGLAAPAGGTSAVTPEGESAKMFIYDVENMKMLKVFDIGDYISGLPYPLHAIASFEGDPEISNKFWGVVSETLFSMTYDFDTGKITIKEELSFDKITIKNGNGWFCNDMLFQDEYIYVMLYKKGGLCRINRNNPKEYEQLLYNFDSVKDMPASFVLGDDGDLYYIAGTALYVLNLDITEEERAVAKSVQDAIDLIPDLETMTLADRETVEAARAAWDAMAPANQPLVKNYEKLEEAEIQLLRLRIAGLGEITIEDEAELVAIRTTYSTLTLEQRMSIDFITVSKAESIMSILRGERMVNIIAAIGEVTLEKESVIRDARAAFMALSLYERRLVTNIDVLNAAEAVLNGLLLQKNEASSVDKLIDKIGFVFFGDGAKISAARKAYNKLDDGAKALVEKHGTLVAAEIILVAEYVILLAAATCGALYAIPATRAKIFKKKEKATEE